MLFYTPTLKDKAVVDNYTKVYGENSCQHSFVAMYSLSEKYNDKICEDNGFLFVLRENLCHSGARTYLSPLGCGDRKQAYLNLIQDAHNNNSKAVFFTLTESQKNFVESEFPGMFECTESRDLAEYIFDSTDLANLPGSLHADNRQETHKFLRDYGDRTQVKYIEKSDLSEIFEFAKDWAYKNSGTHDIAAIGTELNAIKKHLESYDVLGLNGIVVRIDGQIKGFNYGVAISENCFDGIVCKADRAVKNIYKYIFNESAKMLYLPYKYANWEEDVGVPGLRAMKMSYRPCFLLKKYLVKEI